MAKTNIVDAQTLYDSAVQEYQLIKEKYDRANIFIKPMILIRLSKASASIFDAKKALEIANKQ